jgi:hypothetical protein
MTRYYSENCDSWNCCDENLHTCIERSEYIRNVRNKLKKKKLKGIKKNEN